MNDRLSMLRRYRVCMQDIVAKREDVALKRAWSDGLITNLLADLALLLPQDERVLVQEIVVLQNQLWSVSPSALATVMAPSPFHPVVERCQWCRHEITQVYQVQKKGKWYRVCFGCQEAYRRSQILP